MKVKEYCLIGEKFRIPDMELMVLYQNIDFKMYTPTQRGIK